MDQRRRNIVKMVQIILKFLQFNIDKRIATYIIPPCFNSGSTDEATTTSVLKAKKKTGKYNVISSLLITIIERTFCFQRTRKPSHKKR